MPENDGGRGGSRAPVDLGREARIIVRKVQEEILRDPFGGIVERREIITQTFAIQTKKQGAWEDLIAVDEDTAALDFLEDRRAQRGLDE